MKEECYESLIYSRRYTQLGKDRQNVDSLNTGTVGRKYQNWTFVASVFTSQ